MVVSAPLSSLMFISLSFGHSGTRIHNITYYAINASTCKKEKCRFRNTLFKSFRLIWVFIYAISFDPGFSLFRLFGLIWSIWMRWESNPHFTDFKSVASAVGLRIRGLSPNRLTSNRLSLRLYVTFSLRFLVNNIGV